mgnify:FL=1
MGKKRVLGTAEEVCELVATDDRLLPCIDFGHLNCRTGGHMNTREEVKALFDLMENPSVTSVPQGCTPTSLISSITIRARCAI